MVSIMYCNLIETNPNEYTLELFGSLHKGSADTVHIFNKHTVPWLLDLLETEATGSHVIIDLAGLHLIDSFGIKALKDVKTRVTSIGGRVTIRNLKSQPRFYFRILRLDREFTLENA